eukprot:3668659-Rhodomonas_salina.1
MALTEAESSSEPSSPAPAAQPPASALALDAARSDKHARRHASTRGGDGDTHARETERRGRIWRSTDKSE